MSKGDFHWQGGERGLTVARREIVVRLHLCRLYSQRARRALCIVGYA